MSSHIERCACAHQDREDALADDQSAQESAEERAAGKLKAEFLAGLSGARNTVTFAAGGCRPGLHQQAPVQAAWDVLATTEIDAPLLAVLRNSECPLVEELRSAMADAYARLYAKQLADVDLQAQARHALADQYITAIEREAVRFEASQFDWRNQ